MESTITQKWKTLCEPADVVLLSPPFTFPPIASVALSIFQAKLRETGISSKVIFPMFLFTHLAGLEPAARISEMIRNTIIQEYLFAHLTGIEHRYEPEEVVMRLNGVQNDSNEQDIAAVKAARAAAEETVEAAAERIIGMNHGVLVCSSIYTQINAGLVICRLVKERNPKIKTMIGGSVSGETGIRILKDYRYIDFVSLGEGDDTVAQACEILLGRTEEPLPYGIVSYEDIDHLNEIPHPLTADMNTVPSPEYRDYLEEVHREEAGFYGENFYETGAALGYSGNHTLYLEGSRG